MGPPWGDKLLPRGWEELVPVPLGAKRLAVGLRGSCHPALGGSGVSPWGGASLCALCGEKVLPWGWAGAGPPHPGG